MPNEWERLRQEVESLRQEFPEQAYLLYAMGLRLRTMDYDSLATDCVLDGPDDKKIDFFHLDLESGVATVAQGYCAEDWSRESPPANKAADLNTAVNWLLESDIAAIPRPAVRASAEQLRDSLSSKEITRLEILYVHNLPDSTQVDSELGVVRRATATRLEQYPGPPECGVLQASRDTVENWRRSRHEAITIHDEITLASTIPPQELEMAEWRAVIISVPAQDFIGLKLKYGDALFSANVRDYLGSRQRARNINRQIEKTAQDEPHNFWIYNNGITLLTNGFTVYGDKVKLSGMAVINGGQTVGSLTAAAAAQGQLGDAQVLTRAVTCNNQDLIDSVIRYNNTQNPIKAWELRATDRIQRELLEAFQAISVEYRVRRGSSRRRASDVHYDKLGPFLSAFYGDPIAAHKNKAELFENEAKYRKLFDEHSDVRNLLFVYRLGNGVARTKVALRETIAGGAGTADDEARYEYFRYGAFAFVVIHVCAEVLCLWRREDGYESKRRISLEDDILFDQEASEDLLSKLARQVLGPIHAYLRDKDAYEQLKTQAGVQGIVEHTKAMIEQVTEMRPDTYEEFTDPLLLL